MPTSRHPAHPDPPPGHDFAAHGAMPFGAPPPPVAIHPVPQFPRRPIPVTCAIVAVSGIGLMLSGMWLLTFTPLVDGTPAPPRPPSIVAALVFTAVFGGCFGLLVHHLRKGATTAVIVSIVFSLGGTGAALIAFAQAVLDYSRGASAADILAKWLESPAEIVLAYSVSGLLVPVVLVCLLLPRSLRWAVRMHRYRYVRRLQRRGHPAYQPPHYPPVP